MNAVAWMCVYAVNRFAVCSPHWPMELIHCWNSVRQPDRAAHQTFKMQDKHERERVKKWREWKPQHFRTSEDNNTKIRPYEFTHTHTQKQTQQSTRSAEAKHITFILHACTYQFSRWPCFFFPCFSPGSFNYNHNFLRMFLLYLYIFISERKRKSENSIVTHMKFISVL